MALRICVGMAATILTKMSKEIPLPIPFSEIFSPSHTVNMVPAVRVSVTKDKLKKSVLAITFQARAIMVVPKA